MKQYKTKEECLKENGEHAWYEFKYDRPYSCAVYHEDGYCPITAPVEKCYHCPTKRVYTRIQAPKFKWEEITDLTKG